MALSSIAVQGYKAFAERASFAIRPLTMVYGYNSAGKSSLLRLLPLIRDSVASRQDSPLSVRTQAVRGASPSDLFSKKSVTPVMSFEFDFSGTRNLFHAKYDLRTFETSGVRRVVIEKLHLREKNGHVHVLSVDLPTLEKGSYQEDCYLPDDVKDHSVKYAFQGFVPRASAVASIPWKQLLDELRTELEHTNNYVWLGPLRSIAPRIERDSEIFAIDSFGVGVSDLLSRDDLVDGPVIGKVRHWFESNTEYTLRVVRGAHEFGALHSIAFAPKDDPKSQIPMEDTGEGIAQVLPILVAVAMAGENRLGDGPIVAVEHPDLHLHSTVHSGLLGFVFEALSARSKPRFVVETHSEAMLLAVQAGIVEKKIKAADVILHWVVASADGAASVRSLTFDDLGYPVEGDSPVFDWYASVHKEMQRLSSKRLMNK